MLQFPPFFLSSPTVELLQQCLRVIAMFNFFFRKIYTEMRVNIPRHRRSIALVILSLSVTKLLHQLVGCPLLSSFHPRFFTPVYQRYTFSSMTCMEKESTFFPAFSHFGSEKTSSFFQRKTGAKIDNYFPDAISPADGPRTRRLVWTNKFLRGNKGGLITCRAARVDSGHYRYCHTHWINGNVELVSWGWDGPLAHARMNEHPWSARGHVWRLAASGCIITRRGNGIRGCK